MKCVCGYEGEGFNRLGKQKSTEIKIVFNPFNIIIKRERRGVYACPKCGTLKIEVKE